MVGKWSTCCSTICWWSFLISSHQRQVLYSLHMDKDIALTKLYSLCESTGGPVFSAWYVKRQSCAKPIIQKVTKKNAYPGKDAANPAKDAASPGKTAASLMAFGLILWANLVCMSSSWNPWAFIVMDFMSKSNNSWALMGVTSKS